MTSSLFTLLLDSKHLVFNNYMPVKYKADKDKADIKEFIKEV